MVTAFLTGEAVAAAAAGVTNIIFSLKEARRPQFAGRLFSTLILLLIVGALFDGSRRPHSPCHDDDDQTITCKGVDRERSLIVSTIDCLTDYGPEEHGQEICREEDYMGLLLDQM